MLGRRFAAFVIDYLAMFMFTIVYVRVVGMQLDDGRYLVSGWPALVVPLFWLWWFVVMEWQAGVTLGKKIVGIRVEKLDGSTLTFGAAFLRRFCDIVDFWMSFGLVAAICHMRNVRGQRVGDMAAGTVVIRSDKTEANKAPEPTPTAAA